MRYPLAFLGLAAQVPLQNPIKTPIRVMVDETPTFAFKEDPDIFSPKDLVCISSLLFKAYLILNVQIQLGRPGQAVANSVGDLALVPYSKHSFEDKK
jgi:hypothetical protein